MLPRLALFGWMALVLTTTVPWTSFTAHAHWSRVAAIPFQSGTVKLADVAGNIALYVPLGCWWAYSRRARQARQLVHAALTAILVSGACEWTQIYSHGRFPSATDVVANTVGAVLGVILTNRWMRRRSHPPLRQRGERRRTRA